MSDSLSKKILFFKDIKNFIFLQYDHFKKTEINFHDFLEIKKNGFLLFNKPNYLLPEKNF